MAKRSGVGGPPPAGPGPVAAGGSMRSPRREFATAAAAAEYWTLGAMVDAEPYPLPEVEAAPRTTADAVALAQPDAPGIVRGRPPGPPPDAAGVRVAATADGYDYPGPYTRFELPQLLYDQYPWITVGKVFFKQYGKNYVASASAIGKYATWTAGHVVHAGDGKESGWSTDMIFVPAYRDGAAPFGKWAVSHQRARTLWYQKGIPDGLSDDMGGAIVNSLDGKFLNDVVGALGVVWNQGRLQHWNSLGYPAAPPFGGERMHDCQASYAYDGTVSGVAPVAIGCDMTGGCSGGPWVRGLLGDDVLNGHNSYRRNDRPEEMNSPYFDDRAKAFWDELLAETP